jgi:hypothetical protein
MHQDADLQPSSNAPKASPATIQLRANKTKKSDSYIRIIVTLDFRRRSGLADSYELIMSKIFVLHCTATL